MKNKDIVDDYDILTVDTKEYGRLDVINLDNVYDILEKCSKIDDDLLSYVDEQIFEYDDIAIEDDYYQGMVDALMDVKLFIESRREE